MYGYDIDIKERIVVLNTTFLKDNAVNQPIDESDYQAIQTIYDCVKNHKPVYIKMWVSLNANTRHPNEIQSILTIYDWAGTNKNFVLIGGYGKDQIVAYNISANQHFYSSKRII